MSVSVKLDKKAGIGELACKICGQQFQTGINCRFKNITGRMFEVGWMYLWISDLSAPVDVYSDWIDACDAVAREAVTNNEADGGLNPYEALVADNERRDSEMIVGLNGTTEVGNGQYRQEGDVEDD